MAQMLVQAVIFLTCAVLAVPLSRKLGLGAVLGYLFAGMVIGPYGLKLVDDVQAIYEFSEFGVVLLLFIIGLELQPSRLWVLRRQVFGLGLLQVLGTGLTLGVIAWGLGLKWQAALVAGLGLAMSSTALVLQTLAEKQQLTARHGRNAFAILLFQDLAVIPILAALPFLGDGGPTHDSHGWLDAAKAVGMIVGVVIGGRYLTRPLFTAIARFGSREVFTSAALLIVIGVTLLMELVGLSASLGAFLAGVLLADSEYRHELEADIEPFKGLLLGLFFIAVGMSANLALILTKPLLLLALTVGLLLVKALVVMGLGWIFRGPGSSTRKLALALAQGGEFAFVLFGAAVGFNIFTEAQSQLLVVVVTISMLLSPLLFILEDKVLGPWLDRKAEREFDKIEADGNHVVIAGMGRVGQVVARVLNMKKIPLTVLDVDAAQVDSLRRFGVQVYYGDATRHEMLEAAKTGEARLFILAIDDPEASYKTAELVRRHYPDLPILARARNRQHAYRLMDLGITKIYRETWHMSLELAHTALLRLAIPQSEAAMTVARFRDHDIQLLHRQYAVYQDEAKLIQTSQEVRAEFDALLEGDSEERDDEATPERDYVAVEEEKSAAPESQAGAQAGQETPTT
ncbi:MAG TPA: monovalent cation:proton antiporter-2 (CPA2) family protein [Burkholderiales bacterium]|jgi:monovalent cation:proton antiporter-2 (CPA2) family protein